MAGVDSTRPPEQQLTDTDRFVPITGFAPLWFKSFDPHHAPDLTTPPPYQRFDLGDRPELGDRHNAAEGLRGLWGRSGQITLLVYAGQPRKKITIGPWGEKGAGFVSLAQARDWAGKLRRAAKQGRLKEEIEDLKRWLAVGRGEVVNKEKAPADRGRTVKEVANLWRERVIYPQTDAAGAVIAGRKRPEHVDFTVDRFLIPFLGNRYIVEVSETEIVELIYKILAIRTKRAPNGPRTTAMAALAHYKQMWRWAKTAGLLKAAGKSYENPIRDLTAGFFQLRARVRTRIATDEEIRTLWFIHNIMGKPSGFGGIRPPRPVVGKPIALAYRFLLLTGLRSQELRLNRWEWVHWGDKDGEGATLTVPVSIQKLKVKEHENAREWIVPLSKPARDTLAELRELTPAGSPWILTAAKEGGDPQPLARATLSGTLNELAHRGILVPPKGKDGKPLPSLATHDLRRTFRTGIRRFAGRDIAERCLNHALPDMEKVYDQGDYIGERREALDTWAEKVMALVSPDGGGNVVPIKKKMKAAS